MAKSDSGRETGNPLARRLERFARRLETETYTLYLAYKDSRTPWYARAWSALIVAYTLSPIDLIPDFIPVLGYLDDLIIVPLGIWLALKMIPGEVIHEARERAERFTDPGGEARHRGLILVLMIWGLLASGLAWLMVCLIQRS